MKGKLWKKAASLVLAALVAVTSQDFSWAGMTISAAGTNLLTNGDFEAGNTDGWTITLGGQSYAPTLKTAGSDAYMTNNTTAYVNIWNETADAAFSMSQEVTGLTAGTYTATVDVEGETSENATADLEFSAGGKTASASTAGYNTWNTFTIEDITVEESGSVTVALTGTLGAGYWMDVDNFTLTKNVSEEEDKAEKVAALNVLITECAGLTEGNYTQESWSALQAELTEAQAVYNDAANRTAEEIETAYNELQTAKNNLVDASVVTDQCQLVKLQGQTLCWGSNQNFFKNPPGRA